MVLQPSPEEKGIKTCLLLQGQAAAMRCSRALKKKGLRLLTEKHTCRDFAAAEP